MSQSKVFARPRLNLSLSLASARDHWSDFNVIAVVQHLVFGDKIVAFDHEMRLDDEIQVAQEVFDFLGAFDFYGSGWMTQLDLHGGIIGWPRGARQGAKSKQRVDKAEILPPLASRHSPRSPPLAETLPILPVPQD